MTDRSARDELRENFRWWTQIASRWADCDAYGHVNNAAYYSWFDTALTTLAIERGILRGPGQTSIGLCIASSCEFLAPIEFPQTVDVGVRLGHIGGSSLRYELAMFALGGTAPLAFCKFTHVYVDRETRTGVKLNDAQKEAIRDLLA